MGRKDTPHNIGFDDYIKKFNDLMVKYFPTKEEWTPGDDALYKPPDLYRIPLKQADEMRLKAIQYIFHHKFSFPGLLLL